ncbi:hypothetical protein BHE90_017620 [Fusarium euwallaceae]|uniref:Uncharacterized protein n=1 Tax=Fusarium euwallaceae TaxID=1147111 RepID=A0A430KXD4_9HYPO|nr:hypothetical protein BHE90_017620 [Fusarium euwallaceae]
MNSRIHLQQAAPNNQAADRYRNRFQRYSKLDKHDKGGLKQLKRELKQNNLLNLPGFPAASMKLSGRQRASLMSFNCSVLLLLYKNTLQPQEEQFIRDEQRLLDNLAQKLAQHGEPTTIERLKGTCWSGSFDESLEPKRFRALESQTDVGAAVQRERPPPQQPGCTRTPGLSVGDAEHGRYEAEKPQFLLCPHRV